MVNRNMMLGESFEDDFEELVPEEDIYAPEPDDDDEIIDSIRQGEVYIGESPLWCDPFDCQFPNEPELDYEEEEELKSELEEKGESIDVSEDTEFITEVEVSEDTQNRIFQIIDSCRDVLEAFNEGISGSDEKAASNDDKSGKSSIGIADKKDITYVVDSSPRRKYTNKATFERAKFGQIEDADPPVLPKLIFAIVVTLIAASYFGVMANSYFIANQSENPTALKCALGWMSNTPPISLSPLYADIFFTAFGIIVAVAAVAILLIWDNLTQKKARREGKEHGNARFATMSDYKKYRQRHMDIKR